MKRILKFIVVLIVAGLFGGIMMYSCIESIDQYTETQLHFYNRTSEPEWVGRTL